MTPRVAVLIPATQKYTVFVPPILESFAQFFLKDCEVEVIILTDLPHQVKARTFRIAHQPWPGVAIHKLHYICEHAHELASFDYVYMCDADMRVVAPVGREILGDLVVTRHAYYVDKPLEDLAYERNPASTAYVAPGRGEYYYQTAFFGGRYKNVIAMAEDLRAAIDTDFANGIVAVWHDESHINRYAIDHPPDVKLTPSYCYFEGKDLPWEPRILTLAKDDDVIRSVGLETWKVHGRRLINRVARKTRRLLGMATD